VGSPTANIDDEGARLGDARDRQMDQHGVAPGRQADEDEPRARPSSDRQKLEATANRVEQGELVPSGAPDVRPPLDTGPASSRDKLLKVRSSFLCRATPTRRRRSRPGSTGPTLVLRPNVRSAS